MQARTAAHGSTAAPDAGPAEDALWAAHRAGSDPAARQALVLLHLSFAKVLAAKLYGRRFSDDVAFDDYLQFASVGLIEAVDRYDPALGASFKTFAAHRIQGAVLSGVDGLTEKLRQLEVRRSIKRERLASLGARDGAEGDAFGRLASMAVGLALGFMLEDVGMYQAEGGSYGDNSYSEVESRQARDRLLKAVQALPEREGQIIRHHYLQQIPFDQIAESLKLTKGRISQLHRRALTSLHLELKGSGSFDVSG